MSYDRLQISVPVRVLIVCLERVRHRAGVVTCFDLHMGCSTLLSQYPNAVGAGNSFRPGAVASALTFLCTNRCPPKHKRQAKLFNATVRYYR